MVQVGRDGGSCRADWNFCFGAVLLRVWPEFPGRRLGAQSRRVSSGKTGAADWFADRHGDRDHFVLVGIHARHPITCWQILVLAGNTGVDETVSNRAIRIIATSKPPSQMER